MRRFSFVTSLVFGFLSHNAFADLSLVDRLEQATNFKVEWRIQISKKDHQVKLDKLTAKLIEDAKKAKIPKDIPTIVIEAKTTAYSNGLGVGVDDLEKYGLVDILEQLEAHRDRMKAASAKFGFNVSVSFELGQGKNVDALLEELFRANIPNPYAINLSIGLLGSVRGATEALLDDKPNQNYPLIAGLFFKKDTSVAEMKSAMATATQVNDDLVGSGRVMKAKISFFTFIYMLPELRAATQNLPALIAEIQGRGAKILDKDLISSLQIITYPNCLESSANEEKVLELCNNDSADKVIALIQKNAGFLDLLAKDVNIVRGGSRMPSLKPSIRTGYGMTLDQLTVAMSKYPELANLISKSLGFENVEFLFLQFSQASKVESLKANFGGAKESWKVRIDLNPLDPNLDVFRQRLDFAKQKISSR